MIGQRNKREKETGQLLSRTYINTAVRKIVRIFKWGVRRGHVPAGIWQALITVEGLKNYPLSA